MDAALLEAEHAGVAFTVDSMLLARNKTHQAIRDIAARVQTGMLEEDVVAIAKKILVASGMELSRQQTRVRFGRNTLKGMQQASEPGMVLQENDIFFINVAARHAGLQGKGGASFVVGRHPEYERCARDAEVLFHALRGMWLRMGLTGQELHDYASKEARQMGWELKLDWPGQHIAEFPRHMLHTGTLVDCPDAPTTMGYILEVHLLDPQRRFGAFFEDMLLDDSHYPLTIRSASDWSF